MFVCQHGFLAAGRCPRRLWKSVLISVQSNQPLAWGIGYIVPQFTNTPNFIFAIKQGGLGLTLHSVLAGGLSKMTDIVKKGLKWIFWSLLIKIRHYFVVFSIFFIKFLSFKTNGQGVKFTLFFIYHRKMSFRAPYLYF